jgi:fatty acid desaturase
MYSKEKERLVAAHRLAWAGVGIWLLFAAVFFVLEALLLAAYLSGQVWLAIPLVLVIAHLMHTHLIAFHEAAHRTLCPEGWLNDGLGIFIGLFSFMSLALYRAAHQSHHAYLATEQDEELWPFVDPRCPRWARRLAAVVELGLGLLYTPFLFLHAFLHNGAPIRARALRLRVWAELAFIAVVWGSVLALVARYHAWTQLAVLYVAPAALAGSIQSWRKYVEHMGLLGATVLSSTRSVVSPGLWGRLLAFSLFHEPFHGVHHKYARLPHYVLPQFAGFLDCGEEPLPYASYRSAFRDMVTSLVDPRVGAQWRRVSAGVQPRQNGFRFRGSHEVAHELVR